MGISLHKDQDTNTHREVSFGKVNYKVFYHISLDIYWSIFHAHIENHIHLNKECRFRHISYCKLPCNICTHNFLNTERKVSHIFSNTNASTKVFVCIILCKVSGGFLQNTHYKFLSIYDHKIEVLGIFQYIE